MLITKASRAVLLLDASPEAVKTVPEVFARILVGVTTPRGVSVSGEQWAGKRGCTPHCGTFAIPSPRGRNSNRTIPWLNSEDFVLHGEVCHEATILMDPTLSQARQSNFRRQS